MCANSGTNNTTDSSRHKSKLCHSSYCSLQHGAQFPVCDEGAATDRKQGSHMRLVYNSRGSTVPGFCNVSKDARPRMSFHLLITVENLCRGSLWHSSAEKSGILLDPCFWLTSVAIIAHRYESEMMKNWKRANKTEKTAEAG